MNTDAPVTPDEPKKATILDKIKYKYSGWSTWRIIGTIVIVLLVTACGVLCVMSLISRKKKSEGVREAPKYE